MYGDVLTDGKGGCIRTGLEVVPSGSGAQLFLNHLLQHPPARCSTPWLSSLLRAAAPARVAGITTSLNSNPHFSFV